MITENLSTLKIHKLTQEQYDRELEAGNIDATALYLTPEVKDCLYYTTLYAAVSDINNGVSYNSINNQAKAKVKVFPADNGRITVMLLDNVSESVQIDINKDIDLVLNGKTLNFITAESHMNYGAGVSCTINGEVNGSAINKTGITSSGIVRFVNFGGKQLIVNGGTYNLGVSSNVSSLIFSIGANCKLFRLVGCNTTLISTYAETTSATSRTVQSQAVNTEIIDCQMRQESGYGNTVYFRYGGIVENSTIIGKCISQSTGYVYPIYVWNDGSVILKNSTIKGDSADCHAYNASSVGVSNHGTLYLENCYVNAPHSGVDNHGNLYINGGTYTGYCHGGFYFNHGSTGEAFINDATIRAGNYEGEFDYSEKTADIYGAFYIGSGSDATVYLDNCTIDGTGCTQGAFVMRGTDGESNNTVNISNSTVTSGTIRIDPDLGHKLNIGMGGNITTDMVNNPAYAEVTNDLYRRNHADKVLDGNDYEALWANINNIVYTSESNQESAVVPLNADTLGGRHSSEFALITDIDALREEIFGGAW